MSTVDPWFNNLVLAGVQRLYVFSLPGCPAAEVLPLTAQALIDALWAAQREWNEAQDTPRLAEAFGRVERMADRWPTPKALLDQLPARAALPTLSAPVVPPTAEQRAAMERVRGDLVKRMVGSGPALADDQDYPELLRAVINTVATCLVEVDIDPAYAAAVGETVAERVREDFGGVAQYWPKGTNYSLRKRRAQMWADFNGRNHAELARRYGMCQQQVYKWLAIARTEAAQAHQGDLFTPNDSAKMAAAA